MEKTEPKTPSWSKIEAKYNPDLDKYEGATLFPEKLVKANEIIARRGLPKEFYERNPGK